MSSASDALSRLPDSPFVIFAGAGISMVPPTNLPSWRDVNRIVVQALAGPAGSLVGTQRAAEAARILLTRHGEERLPPEYQAEILADILGQHYFEVLQHLDSDRPNAVHLTIAWLARLGRLQAVITTNFDRALEAGFQAVGAPVERHFSPEHFAALARGLDRLQDPGRPCQLLKLHGSVDDPATLIDTLAQRKRGFPEPVTQCLRHLLHAGPWVFLGFSGLDLEADPNYLSLAEHADTAAGFVWLVRQGTEPRKPVLRLKERYGERGKIAFGDLPDWLADRAERVSADLRPAVASTLADIASPVGDALAQLDEAAAAWGRRLSPDACAICLARLVTAAAQPSVALDLWQSVREALDQGWSSGSTVAPDRLRAIAANSLGTLLGRMGRHAEAIHSLQEAVRLCHEREDVDARDRCLSNLAWSTDALGDPESARVMYETALAGFESRDDDGQIATTANRLSTHQIRQGRLEPARELAEKALAHARRVGNEVQRIIALNNLGVIAQRLEQYDVALQHYDECAQVCRRLGDDGNLAAVLGSRGDTLALQGRFDEAEALYREGLALLSRVDRPDVQAETFRSLAHIALKRGDATAALAHLTAGLEMYRAMGTPTEEAMTLFQIAGVHGDRGDFEKALALHERALALVEGKNRSSEGHIRAQIGFASFKLGRSLEAEHAYRESRAIGAELGDEYLRALSAENLALVLLVQQKDAEAAAVYAEAADLWDKLRDDDRYAQAKLGQAAVLLDQVLGALSDAGHRFGARGEQREAARQMLTLYPELIALYQRLGAQELAAHFAFSQGSTAAFLDEVDVAVATYRSAAEMYGAIGRQDRRREALSRAEKLLNQQANALMQEGRIADALAPLLNLIEVSRELEHREMWLTAILNSATVLLHATQRVAEARELAQTVLAHLPPDSDLAKIATSIIQRCDGTAAGDSEVTR